MERALKIPGCPKNLLERFLAVLKDYPGIFVPMGTSQPNGIILRHDTSSRLRQKRPCGSTNRRPAALAEKSLVPCSVLGSVEPVGQVTSSPVPRKSKIFECLTTRMASKLLSPWCSSANPCFSARKELSAL